MDSLGKEIMNLCHRQTDRINQIMAYSVVTSKWNEMAKTKKLANQGAVLSYLDNYEHPIPDRKYDITSLIPSDTCSEWPNCD